MYRLLYSAGGPAVLPPHPGIHGDTIRRFFALRGALSPSQPALSASFRPAGGPDYAYSVPSPTHEQPVTGGQDPHSRPSPQKCGESEQQPCRAERCQGRASHKRDQRSSVEEALVDQQGV